MQINFFDCNCSFGCRGVVYPGSFTKRQDLAARMKYYGIRKALVYHSLAREYDPAVGNRLLLDEIAGTDCLLPVWIAMPQHTGEFPEPGALKEQLFRHQIKAVRLFPAAADQNFSLSGWSCGGLFTLLDQCRIPLILGMDQIKWEEVHDICSAYSGLKMILTGMNYRMDRFLYPLLARFEHLRIETSGYKVHNGIEEICRKFGPERLVFGSGMPEFSGSAAVSMIHYAGISGREKEMIAGENLEQLVGGITYA